MREKLKITTCLELFLKSGSNYLIINVDGSICTLTQAYNAIYKLSHKKGIKFKTEYNRFAKTLKITEK